MSVKLTQVWQWTCPHCGETNYHGGCRVDDPEAQKQAREELGCDGELLMQPERVVCAGCEHAHDVTPPTEDG